MLAIMWSKWNTLPSLMGAQMCIVSLEINMVVSQEDENHLPQDPAMPLLGIYTKDVSSYYRDTCSTMFIAALFIIARNWKQPRYPSMDKWIKKMSLCLYKGILLT